MLKIDSVQLTYKDRKILQDIYLNCRPGEIVGILGRNGCGKSSLLKVIFGTIKPDYKYLSINGKHILKGYNKSLVAYLPQHHFLPARINIKNLAEQLVDLNDWDEFCSYPIYQQYQTKKPGELSGGELRQLETLMILYSKAPFILLDEPFTHISPVQAEDFKLILKKRALTKGIIITDHQYYNILEISHRIVLIENGSTKLITNHTDLITYGYLSGN